MLFGVRRPDMKTVAIRTGSGASMDAIMAVYPWHKALVEEFTAHGDLIGIGPFTDLGGNLAIFRSREAAQAFVNQDTFIPQNRTPFNFLRYYMAQFA